MRRTLAAGLALFLTAVVLSAAHADPLRVVSEGDVTEPNSTRFVLHSDRLGRAFAVVVQLPHATVLLPGQKLAVIYALDGGHAVAGPQARFLGARAVMAPSIIVSIDYLPGQGSFRTTDLSHIPFSLGGETMGGGGAVFEAFLLQDLRPFIETKYPADPGGSVLFGHSMGAVFAANVYANNPNAFAGYILGSFVAPRDPSVVARVAKASARARGQRVFLAVGGDEDGFTAEDRKMRQGFADMTAALQGHPGVHLKAQIYPGENHLSFYPSLVIDGFRFVLPPTLPVNTSFAALPETTIARYVGAYDMPDGQKITVKSAGSGTLTLEVADKPLDYLLPNGPNRYYAFRSDLDVRFDDAGLTLVGRGSATVRAERETTR